MRALQDIENVMQKPIALSQKETAFATQKQEVPAK